MTGRDKERTVSKKKQILLDAKDKAPFIVGEEVGVREIDIEGNERWVSKEDKKNETTGNFRISVS